VVPTGWTLVAFSGNQNTACPGQSTQDDVYEGPNTSSVCSCACALATPPTCPAGPINVKYDENFNHSPLSCNMTGSPAQMKNAAACNTDLYGGGGGLPPGYESLDLSYTPAPPTGGMCTPRANTTAGNLTYAAQDRICTPNTEPCTGSDCTPSFGSGWGVCISNSGSQSCPGTPFTVQHIVGGAATFTCSSNSCGCQVTGTCAGTLTLYTNNNCTGTEQTVTADGACLNGSTAFNSNTYGSYAYATGTPQASCNPSGTSTAQNVALSNVQTVCCTQ
jgi:hypothetical protein